jgi:hypothetical protein
MKHPSGSLRLVTNLLGWSFINAFALLILPTAITIAILRYKLWNIDLLILKTVQYAVVTVVFAFIYFGAVVLLQALLGLVTMQQVLAQLTQTARQEVSLDALTVELDRVVQETMQPEQMMVWLKLPHERSSDL